MGRRIDGDGGAASETPRLRFGLLEHRREAITGDRFGARPFYRKSPFFDRFLGFDRQVERELAVLE